MDKGGRRSMDGEWCRPTRDEVFSLVRTITADKTGVVIDEVTPRARFAEDLGIDSLTAIEILAALCPRFDITIDEDDIVDVETVGDLLELIEEKLG